MFHPVQVVQVADHNVEKSIAVEIGQILFVLDSRRLSASFLGFAQFFLVGLLLADIYVADWKRTPRSTRSWEPSRRFRSGILPMR